MRTDPPPAPAPPPTLTRTLRGLLVLVVALPLVVLVAIALWLTDLPSFWQALTRCDWRWVALGYAGSFLPFPLMALRWRLLLMVPAERRPGLLETSGYLLIAQLFNLAIPGPAGDVAVSSMLKLRRRIPMASSLAAGAYGRLLGILLTALVPLVMAPRLGVALPGQLQSVLRGVSIVAIGGMLLLLLMALLPLGWSHAIHLLQRVGSGRPGPSGPKGAWLAIAIRVLTRFSQQSRLIASSPGRLLASLLLSAAVIAVNALCFQAVLWGMGVHLTFAWVLLVFCVHVLAQVPSFSVPGSGSVSAPLAGVLLLSGLLGFDEGAVIGALLLATGSLVLQSVAGLIIAIPWLGMPGRASRAAPRPERSLIKPPPNGYDTP